MARVEQEIVVKIKTIIDGLNEIKSYSDAVKGLGKSGTKSLTSDFLKAGSAAGVASAAVSKLVDGLERVASVGANALTSFIEEGIRFNAVIESSRIGIATLVANTYDVRDAQGTLLDPLQAFNASLEKSEELERALQKSAIETKFEFQDVLTFFNSSVIASAGLKTNLEQILQLTQDFALAAGAANINVEKVNTGIQQILTGNTTVRNQLSRVIFPGLGTKEINEQLRKYKEAGTLVDFLEEKMKVFRLSADQVSQSFEAVGSNATDAFKVFAAQSTLPLFDKLKETFGFFISQVVDLSGEAVKLTPTFEKIATIIGDILGFLGERMLALVKSIFEYITYWADYLYQNRDAVERITVSLYVIVEQVAMIAADLFGIVGDIGTAAGRTGTWTEKFQYLALFVGFVRDIINVIIGYIEQAIGGVLYLLNPVKWLTDGMNAILDILDRWIGRVTVFTSYLRTALSYIGYAAEKQDQFGTQLFENGYNRVQNHNNFQSFDEALNAQNSLKFPTFDRNRGKSNFSFTPRLNLNKNSPDGGGRGGAERAERERIRDAQRLYNEIEKYQIANSNRVLELATAANKALLELEQRRYDKGLLSAEQYYARKAEIENADLDNQRDNLKKQSEYAEVALNRDLGAIAGKFSITNEEVTSVIEKIKSLTEQPDGLASADATTIKQAIEYTKYLEQTAEITQKLSLIEQKRADITAGTTEATEKQARANKTLFDGLAAEFGQSAGNDGLSELNNLQKRVADEFPKILTETNKALPGIKEFASEIYKAASVDASAIPQLLADAGIKFEDLSEEARLFIKLMERLQNLARIKGVGAQVDRAQNAFKFASEGSQTDFENGRIDLGTALAQNTEAKVKAVAALNEAYKEQQAILKDLQLKGIATPEDAQNVEALRRAIAALNSDLDKLALIRAQEERDGTRIATAISEVDARRQSGEISSNQAKRETLLLQQQQIAALQAELLALQALDQTNLQVQTKVAETQVKLAEMRNTVNADFITFAQGINDTVGGSFSTFIDTIQNGTESIGDAFKQLLASLLLGIAKAIAQALLLKFVLAPLGLTGGDSGGIGGFLGGLIFGKKAEGGIISGAGTGVSDTAGIFALSHGEGVIPAASVRKYGASMINSIISGSFIPRISVAGFAAGGFPAGVEGNGRGGVRIVNAIDPSLVADFLSSAAGEEIILNVIGKNPGLVQRLV